MLRPCPLALRLVALACSLTSVFADLSSSSSQAISASCSYVTSDDNNTITCKVEDSQTLYTLVSDIQSAWSSDETEWESIEAVTLLLEEGEFLIQESIEFFSAPDRGGHIQLVGAGSTIGSTIRCVEGTNSSALNISAPFNVTIEDLSFKACARSITAEFPSTPTLPVNLALKGCSFMENFGRTAAGVAAFAHVTSVTIISSLFYDNYCEADYSSGAVSIEHVDSINIIDSTFRNNSSPGFNSAGAIRAEEFNNILVQGCVFENHTLSGNKSVGTLMLTSDNISSTANISKSRFRFNHATKAQGVGAAFISGLAKVSIDRSLFFMNKADGDISRGALYLYLVSTALVYKVDFIGNSADCDPDNQRTPTRIAGKGERAPSRGTEVCGGGAIMLYMTDLFLAGSTFIENMARTFTALGGGGAILYVQSTEAHVVNCTFVGNVAVAGGALNAWQATRLIIDAPFFNTHDPCKGDLSIRMIRRDWPILWEIYTEMPWGTQFINNTGVAMGGAIGVTDASLSIGFFPDFKCTAYPIAAIHTTFRGNRALTGGAITALRPYHFHMVYTFFYDNSALPSPAGVPAALATVACGVGNGGALCLVMTGLSRGMTHAVGASVFEGNSAIYGGAMYITADENTCTRYEVCNLLHLTGLMACDTDFLAFYTPGMGNIMFPTSKVNISNNMAHGGAGGGIYFEHTGLVNLECGDNNYPIYSKPWPWNKDDLAAVGLNSSCVENSYWYQPTDMKKCSDWTGNKATGGGFGDDMAGTPYTFTAELLNPWQLENYTSGDPMPLRIKAFDMFGSEHVVQTRNYAGAADTLYSVYALAGSQSITNFNIKAIPGRLPENMSTIQFQSYPGPVTLRVEASITKIRRTLQPTIYNVHVRKCMIGELTKGLLCLKCDAGLYNLRPTDVTCSVCPENAICNTDTTDGAINAVIAPIPGYFHSNPFSANIIQCIYQKACDSDDRTELITLYQDQLSRADPYDPLVLDSYNVEEYYDIMCSEGYTGPLCAVCKKGYGATQTGCHECNSNYSQTIAVVLIIQLIALIPLVWSMWIAMAEYEAYFGMRVRMLTAPNQQCVQTQASALKILISYLQVLGMLVWVNIDSSVATELFLDNMQDIATSIMYISSSVPTYSIPCTLEEQGMQAALTTTIVAFVYPIFGLVVLILLYGFPDFWSSLRHKIFGTLGTTVTHPAQAVRSAFTRRLQDFSMSLSTPRQSECGAPGNDIGPSSSNFSGLFSKMSTSMTHYWIVPEELRHPQSCVLPDPGLGTAKGNNSDPDSMPPPNLGAIPDGNLDTNHDSDSSIGRRGISPSRPSRSRLAKETGSGINLPSPRVSQCGDSDPSFPSRQRAPVRAGRSSLPTDTGSDINSPPPRVSQSGDSDPSLPSPQVAPVRPSRFRLGVPYDSTNIITIPEEAKQAPRIIPPGTPDAVSPRSPFSPMSQDTGPFSDGKQSAGVLPCVGIKLERNDSLDDSMDEQTIERMISELPQNVLLRGTTGTRAKFVTAVVIAVTIAAYYFYPMIAQQTILIFMCYKVDEQLGDSTDLGTLYGLNSGYRWYSSFDSECFEGAHLALTLYLGIPGIIFSLGTPILWVWWLHKNRNRLEDNDFKARFSFMWQDYKPEFYAWGALELLRKLILLCILMLLSDNYAPPGLQVILALFVCHIWLSMTVVYKPQKDITCARLELFSIYAIHFTLVCLLFYTYNDVPDGYVAFMILAGIHNLATLIILLGAVSYLGFCDRVKRANLRSSQLKSMTSKEVTDAIWADMPGWLHVLKRWFYIAPMLICWRMFSFVKSKFKKLVKYFRPAKAVP